MTEHNQHSNSLDSIYQWRLDVFTQAVNALCDQSVFDSKRAAGVWNICSSVPALIRDDAQLFASGCMNLKMNTTAGDIFICVWMFVGEVRIGLKVSKSVLVQGDDRHFHSEFPNVYDGSSCSRIQNCKEHNMYDWIFRDGFASFQFMQKSIEDDVSKGMLIDALVNIITHLHMSTANLLMSSSSVKFK